MTLRDCSNWCARMCALALGAGDLEAAHAYQQMFSLWERRFKEAKT